MFRSLSCCNAKIYGETVLNEEIPVNKYQKKIKSYVKVGRNDVHYINVVNLWVRLWSIFHCNVNSEFMFDEQWMKETSQDLTLDFFQFLSKYFFPKIWAAKFRVQLIDRFLQYIFTKCIARVPRGNGYWSCLVALCTAVALCYPTIFFYFANSFVNLHTNNWFQWRKITSSMQYADLLNLNLAVAVWNLQNKSNLDHFFYYFVGK